MFSSLALGMSTPPTTLNDPPLRPLSADAFIRAMKGETVVDENGEETSFYSLENKCIILFDIEVIEELSFQFTYEFRYDIYLTNVRFRFKVSINEGVYENHIQIEDCEFNSEFVLLNGSINNGISILSGVFKKGIGIYEGVKLGSLYISDGEFLEGVIIHGGEIGTITFLDGDFSSLQFGGGTFTSEIAFFNGNFRGH